MTTHTLEQRVGFLSSQRSEQWIGPVPVDPGFFPIGSDAELQGWAIISTNNSTVGFNSQVVEGVLVAQTKRKTEFKSERW